MFHQQVFKKSNISWPIQLPKEGISDINKKLDFLLFISEKGTSIGHFGARDDPKWEISHDIYKGSPTCTVSTSTDSTNTNSQKVVLKVILVGDLLVKFVLSGDPL